MKSYGKVDETWNDERFRGLIEDALKMARNSKKRHVIGQDGNGNVVVTGDRRQAGSCAHIRVLDHAGLVRNSILSCSMYVPVLFIRRQVGSSGSSRTCRTVRRYLYI